MHVPALSMFNAPVSIQECISFVITSVPVQYIPISKVPYIQTTERQTDRLICQQARPAASHQTSGSVCSAPDIPSLHRIPPALPWSLQKGIPLPSSGFSLCSDSCLESASCASIALPFSSGSLSLQHPKCHFRIDQSTQAHFIEGNRPASEERNPSYGYEQDERREREYRYRNCHNGRGSPPRPPL